MMQKEKSSNVHLNTTKKLLQKEKKKLWGNFIQKKK